MARACGGSGLRDHGADYSHHEHRHDEEIVGVRFRCQSVFPLTSCVFWKREEILHLDFTFRENERTAVAREESEETSKNM